eukprot:3891948-Rhodomonas_salina.2
MHTLRRLLRASYANSAIAYAHPMPPPLLLTRHSCNVASHGEIKYDNTPVPYNLYQECAVRAKREEEQQEELKRLEEERERLAAAELERQ